MTAADDANPLTLAFASEHPEEVAALLARSSAGELVQVIGTLPATVAPAVIARLGRGNARRVLDATDEVRIAAWLSGAGAADALGLLVHIEEDRRSAVLAQVRDRKLRRDLERMMVYPEQTVGAIANPAIPRLGDNVTVGDAIRLLRRDQQQGAEPVWIVDPSGRLRGQLDFARLLNARTEQTTLKDCAMVVIPLRAEMSLGSASEVREWLEHPVLPVIDVNHYLVGALSRQRLMADLQTTRREQGLSDGVATLAAAYMQFLASCLADILSGRRPP